MENEQKVDRLLKEIDMEVPTAVRKRIDDTLVSLPKKSSRSRWVLFAAIAASLMLVAVVGSSLSPAFAKTLQSIPVIGSVFDMFGDDGLKQQTAGSESETGQTVSSNSSTLTVTDVIYDGSRLSIGYIQTFEGDIDPNDIFEGIQFKINGKSLLDYGAGLRGQELEESQYAGILTIDGVPDKEAFTLTIELSQLGVDKGKWELDIPVKKIKGGQVYLINQRVNYKDMQLVFEQIAFNPATVEIKYNSMEPLTVAEQRWDEEKRVESSILLYRLFDEEGLEFAPLGASTSGGERNGLFIEEGQLQYVPSGEQHEYVTIQVVEVNINSEEAAPVYRHELIANEKVPFTLSQGEVGEIVIEKIEHLTDQTVIEYVVRGEDEYNQANGLWLEDGEGNEYYSTNIFPKRVNDSEKRYKQEFDNLSHIDDLTIWTYEMEQPNVIDEITIPLDMNND